MTNRNTDLLWHNSFYTVVLAAQGHKEKRQMDNTEDEWVTGRSTGCLVYTQGKDQTKDD